MTTLLPHQCRVLGVLVEKAQTTPAQYPLTLNALVAGCNQKSNRNPVLALGEDDVLTALDGLRGTGLVREVLLSGSRVGKFRHNAREALSVETSEMVVLAELLLRGPQTVGELRSRASRMHPLESVEAVELLLDGLMRRDPPMVRQLPPAPGTRAARYVQLLGPYLHATDVASSGAAPPAAAPTAASPQLAARVEVLEAELERLKRAVEHLAESVGA